MTLCKWKLDYLIRLTKGDIDRLEMNVKSIDECIKSGRYPRPDLFMEDIEKKLRKIEKAKAVLTTLQDTRDKY